VSDWRLPPQALDGRIAPALHPLDQPPSRRIDVPPDLRDLIPADDLLRPAAVLIGLVDRGQGSAVILTRRTEALSQHPGQVAFPGGRRDEGDTTLVATALRESAEEISLLGEHVTPLGYIDPLPTFTGFLVFPVVARVSAAHLSVADPREVAAVFEVPLDYLLDPDNVLIESALLQGRARRTWRFDYAGQRIWGATAAMLLNLRERLGPSQS